MNRSNNTLLSMARHLDPVYYWWAGVDAIVPTVSPKLSHRKYVHNHVMAMAGEYDFTPILLDYKEALSRGMEFGFKLRPMLDKGDWQTVLTQDWNSPEFLSGHRKLIFALSQALGDQRGIAFIEISYGSFGEGADLDGMMVRDESVFSIIDDYFDAFPNVRLLTPCKTRPQLVKYALRWDYVGWMVANLGGPDEYFSDILPELKGRYCRGEFKAREKLPDYWRAYYQAKAWNIRHIGNGNLYPWKEQSAQSKLALLEIATLCFGGLK